MGEFDGFVKNGQETWRGEDGLRLTIFQQRGDLLGFVVCIERDGHGADALRAEVSGDPVGIVIGKDGAAGAQGDAAFDEPRADAVGELADLAVGEAFDARGLAGMLGVLHFDHVQVTMLGDARGQTLGEIAHRGVVLHGGWMGANV